MKKISIIVPVYNTSQYLKKCLNSLVNQNLDNYEIVVVNDGSLDGSQKIINDFEKDYPELVFGYKKKNGGLSDARNYGIRKANSKYIGFVDSDDYVEKDMFRIMYEKIISNDYDICVCDINYVYNKKNVVVSSNIINDTEDIKKVMLNIYPTAWNKLYRKSLFIDNNLEFKKGVWFEDVEFIYRVLPFVKKIGTVKKALYKYVQREGAISKTFDERLFNYIDNWNGIVEFYKKHDLFNYYFSELEYSYVRYIYGTFLKQAMHYKNTKDFKKALNTAIKNVKNIFPNYRHNKHFRHSLKGLFLIIFNRPLVMIIYFLRRNHK